MVFYDIFQEVVTAGERRPSIDREKHHRAPPRDDDEVQYSSLAQELLSVRLAVSERGGGVPEQWRRFSPLSSVGVRGYRASRGPLPPPVRAPGRKTEPLKRVTPCVSRAASRESSGVRALDWIL